MLVTIIHLYLHLLTPRLLFLDNNIPQESLESRFNFYIIFHQFFLLYYNKYGMECGTYYLSLLY